MSRIGIITIGRNEGERLIRCLQSLTAQMSSENPIVYVDSGSTDRSCEVAREKGIDVVNLDLSIPFTAARARNAGFDRLRQTHPEIEYVQFIDGDCEVIEGWVEVATQALDQNPEVVAVCGWRRERYPEQSFYNRICDVEWRSGAIGSIGSFGGDVMIRAQALIAVGGYNDRVIAAEDDELSVRLRQTQGQILRIDHNSTLHDANIHHLGQWWIRAKRCGYAYALVHHLHGKPPEQKFRRELIRTWLWGFWVPFVLLALAFPTHGWSFIGFLRYPVTALRVMQSTHQRGFPWAHSMAWGISCAVSSVPEVFGAIKFYLDRRLNQQAVIIEYKGSEASVTDSVQTTGR